jgi:hypothetical protein
MSTSVAQADQVARERRLVSVLSRARGRNRRVEAERWLMGLGGALAIGGVLLVIVGWVGTSRTVLVAGQIPYVVSGGLLGVAFVFLGGFLYFGYWTALLVRESRERSVRDRTDMARMGDSLDEVTKSLAAIADLLEANLRATPPRPARRPRSVVHD